MSGSQRRRPTYTSVTAAINANEWTVQNTEVLLKVCRKAVSSMTYLPVPSLIYIEGAILCVSAKYL